MSPKDGEEVELAVDYVEIRAMGETAGQRYPVKHGQVIIKQMTLEQVALYFGQPQPLEPQWVQDAHAELTAWLPDYDDASSALHAILPIIREGLAEEVEAQDPEEFDDEVQWTDEWDKGYSAGIATAAKTILGQS